MKTAVIYARYSCDKQNETSIDGQLRVCNEYAERNDIIILDNYIDRATSGTNDNRPAFQQMLRDSDKKVWDYVLVYKLDRFSRNKYEMATHKKHLKDNGIKVLSAMENIPDTPEGIILESLLEGMAEYFSAELSQKINRGLRESRLKGYWTGGKPPYGYKSINKRLVIDEEQARVVRYIYSQAASGVMIKKIVEELHEQGVMYNGRLIVLSTVYKILRSERYTGICHQHEELYDNIFPRIIDDETYKIVRNRLEDNLHNGKTAKVEYLLKNKIFCGYCGKPIISETGTSKTGVLNRYYKCSTRKHGGNCTKQILRKDLLEELVINIINKTFGTKNNLDKIAEEVLTYHKDRVAKHSILNNLLKTKNKIDKALNNLADAAENGLITETLIKRMHKLEEQSNDIAVKIAQERTRLKKEVTKEDVIKFVKETLKRGSREIIFTLIDKIILYDDKIEIYYNLIKTKDPDDKHQGLLIYNGIIPFKTFNIDKQSIVENPIQLYIYIM